MNFAAQAVRTRNSIVLRVASSLALACFVGCGHAQGLMSAPREIPAYSLPLPQLASKELQALITRPMPLATALANIVAMEKRLHVQVRNVTFGGVKCFELRPSTIPEANRHRILMHLHGGAYVAFGGMAGIGEAVLMAGFGHFRVISVDYRLAPQFPYPASLDDVTTVWRALTATEKPANSAVFGTSAGGSLALELVQRAKTEHLPVPAAIAIGSPWADLSMMEDSVHTNAFVDDQVSAGILANIAHVYANGMKLTDPRISPLYGDFKGFPPTILISGTRDLLLSDTVLVQRKLREANVEASLEIFEGMSHAEFLLDDRVPETQAIFHEIATFFDNHLGAS